MRAQTFTFITSLLAACGAPPVPPTPPTATEPAPTAPPVPAVAPASSATVVPARLALPAAASPAVAIRLVFRSGSADDPTDAPGATALAARLMAEGGTQADTAFALKQRLFPWAAELGVQVEADMTVFTATVHRDHVEAFLPIMSAVLTAPRWEAAEFERLRRDALDDLEKRLRTSDDENLGKAALSHLLYAGHPYGHFVGGSVAGLNGLTLERLRAHAATTFCKARLTIGVAGGDATGLSEQIATALAALPDGAPATRLPEPVGLPGRVLLVEKDAPAVAISLGLPVAFDRAHPDFAALLVGVSAFGEHRQFHGRLMQRMREERGLNYGDYAYPEFFQQEGWSTFPQVNIARRQQMFSLWIRPVQPADAHFALRLALHEYDKLLREGLTEEEVKRAGQFLEGYTRVWEKNPHRRLGMALDDAFYGTAGRLEAFRRAVGGLNAATVNAALREHLPAVSALKVVVVTSGAAKFRDALVADAPSPKAYDSEKPKSLLEEDAVIAVRKLGIPVEAIKIVPVNDLF